MALSGPEPCSVRGDYHQWAFLEREAGEISFPSDGSVGFVKQGPSRLVFFCSFCLAIRRLDELVGRSG